MVQTGDKIDTNFKLDIVRNGKEENVQFSDLLNRPVIVSVYMRNNTSSCDIQNQSLADHADYFDKKGYNLIALSKDTCGSHKNYAKKIGVRYILASDPGFRFAKATGSIVQKKMYGKTFDAPSRSAYVIDTDGIVRATIPKVNTKAHAEELKELIEGLD